MINKWTGTIHNHCRKTIKSSNRQEVTRSNSVWVDVNVLDWSLNHIPLHSNIDKVGNSLFCRGRSPSLELRCNLWHTFSCKTNEGLNSCSKWLKLILEILTEIESLNTTKVFFSSGSLADIVKSHFVQSRSKENLKVIDLSIGKQDSLLTQRMLFIFKVHSHFKSRIRYLIVSHSDIAVAHAFPLRLWIALWCSICINR